jgi:hypothetical protein
MSFDNIIKPHNNMLSKIAFALISLFFVGATCTPDPLVHSGSTIIKNNSTGTVKVVMLVVDRKNYYPWGYCKFSDYTTEQGENQTVPIEDVTKFATWFSIPKGTTVSSTFGPVTCLNLIEMFTRYPQIVIDKCDWFHIYYILIPDWYYIEAPGDVLTIT